MTKKGKPVEPSELKGIIDRIEDGRIAVVVLDDGQELHWPASRLPQGAREGIAIVLALAVDPEDTASRLERSKELLRDIFTE